MKSAHGFAWEVGMCTASVTDPIEQHGDVCRALRARDAEWQSHVSGAVAHVNALTEAARKEAYAAGKEEGLREAAGIGAEESWVTSDGEHVVGWTKFYGRIAIAEHALSAPSPTFPGVHPAGPTCKVCEGLILPDGKCANGCAP